MAKELHKLDLYGVLGVEESASEKEILKGYRKKALKCHPDKNPDNPKAAEEFHQLSEALQILTDIAARTAYDRSRKAKKEADARNQALDSKRKKFKEDLEAREQAAEERLKSQKTAAAEKNLQKEIERLRREGSRLLEQEQERLRQELRSNAYVQDPEASDVEIVRLKLKWKTAKDDPANGGYDQRTLTDILNCYGRVNTLLISTKRSGSAVVEFEASGVSSDILEEKGLPENPFTVIWLSGRPSEISVDADDFDASATGSTNVINKDSPLSHNSQQSRTNKTPLFTSAGHSGDSFSTSDVKTSHSNGSDGKKGSDGKDFESLVLMRMRQAEERKRLIEQMKEDDDG